jgi:hypothetical protein
VDYPFASCYEGPGFKSPGVTDVKPGFILLALSRYIFDNSYKRLKEKTAKELLKTTRRNQLPPEVFNDKSKEGCCQMIL